MAYDNQRKFSPLTQYIYWVKNGKPGCFPEDAKSLYTPMLFNLTECDIAACVLMDRLINMNPTIAYSMDTEQFGNFHKMCHLPQCDLKYIRTNKLDKVLVKKIQDRYPIIKAEDIPVWLDSLSETEKDTLMELIGYEVSKMEKVEKSFALLEQYLLSNLDKNCPTCSNNRENVLYDSSTDDINKVKLLFVGECPAKEEVAQGKPFVGRSGQLLRGILSSLTLPTDYMITNSCLCFHAPGNPPTQTELHNCFDNIQTILSLLKKEVIIVPLGASAMSRFGINEKVGDACQKLYKYDNRVVVPAPHPSAILRGAIPEETLRTRIQLAADMTNGVVRKRVSKENAIMSMNVKETISNQATKQQQREQKKEEVRPVEQVEETKDATKINTDVMLVDSFVAGESINFVFRKGSEKIVTTEPDTYTYYMGNSEKTVEHKSKLIPMKGSYSRRWQFLKEASQNTYGADISLSVIKNCAWRASHEETMYPLRVCYIDIELFTNNDTDLTLDDLAAISKKYPINLLTVFDSYDKKYHVLINNMFNAEIDIEQIKGHLRNPDEFEIVPYTFANDKELIAAFLNLLDTFDPDIITGWNTGRFDWPYIIYRCNVLKLDCNIKHGKISYEEKYGDTKIPTIVELDYLRLYKEMSFGERESYSLDYISGHELPNESKLHLDDKMDMVFMNDPNKFIAYNINDVRLVRMLDDKLRYIDLMYSIVLTTNIGWREGYTTLRILDGLMYTYLYETGRTITSRHDTHGMKATLKGAYVRQPIAGVYDWLGDLDATAMYPTIICRFNLSPDTYVGSIPDEEAYLFIYSRQKFLTKSATVDLTDKAGITSAVRRSDFEKWMLDHKYIIAICGTIYKSHEEEVSPLYEVVDLILSKRKEYKKKMLTALEQKDDKLYDRYWNAQTTYKVIANSLYGGVCNEGFRLFHNEMAKTITSTGRELIKLAAYQTNKFLLKMEEEKKIDVEFVPISEDFEEEAEKKLSNIIYGDSITGNSRIQTNHGEWTISELFDVYHERCKTDTKVYHMDGLFGKQYVDVADKNIQVTTVDTTGKKVGGRIETIVKHKTDKRLFKIRSGSGKEIVVTEDHSVMIKRDNDIMRCRPTELLPGDVLIVP